MGTVLESRATNMENLLYSFQRTTDTRFPFPCFRCETHRTYLSCTNLSTTVFYDDGLQSIFLSSDFPAE